MKQPPSSTNNLDASLPVRLLTAGTSACIADLLTFPLDTAKVRLQIQGEGLVRPITIPVAAATVPIGAPSQLITPTVAQPITPQYRGLIGTISTITRQEGPRALYNGLSAGLQRQMCFASVRLGLYDTVKEFYQRLFNEKPGSLFIFTRVLAGLTTGGVAVLIAQPTDVVKVRFQAANRSTNASAPRYKSTTQAYVTIHREEGVRGLWRGAMPNIGRNAIVNVTETVCYDVIKDCLLMHTALKDNIYCHFTAAFFAGLATTIASSPIDVVKTRYMNSPKGKYASSIDVMVQMFRNEGAMAFYKGFVPNFCRMVTWNIGLWITYEQIKKITFTKRSDS